jgi:acetylornithine deacetylase
VSGTKADSVPMSYWADSAFIAAVGIPTVLYGPDGDGAHADVEWVSLTGTATCARVLTTAATMFCA